MTALLGMCAFQSFIGVMSRENQLNQLPINSGAGSKLQIFVENQGRINYNVMNDFKGILGKVTLNGQTVLNWTITGYPLEHYREIEKVINLSAVDPHLRELLDNAPGRAYLRRGPTLFHGNFEIYRSAQLLDTYLDPTGWGKVFSGVASNIFVCYSIVRFIRVLHL